MSTTQYQPNDDFRNSIATVDAAGKRVWLYPSSLAAASTAPASG